MAEVIILSFLKLISMGFSLGLGFWLSKKLSGLIDELLFLMNKKKIAQLVEV
jgi:hypothetical protein